MQNKQKRNYNVSAIVLSHTGVLKN